MTLRLGFVPIAALALACATFSSVAVAAPQLRPIKRVAKTTIEMSATKDAEGNVAASISLSSAEPTCLNSGRVAPQRQFDGTGVPSEADFGYGSEVAPGQDSFGAGEPLEGVASYTKSGYFDGVLFEKTDFVLNPTSAPGVSPWIWQGSWAAGLKTVVQGPGGAYTSTVSSASFLHLEMTLYLHRKVYGHRQTKEVLICPGKTVSRWLPL
jgi:hypothetical protein